MQLIYLHTAQFALITVVLIVLLILYHHKVAGAANIAEVRRMSIVHLSEQEGIAHAHDFDLKTALFDLQHSIGIEPLEHLHFNTNLDKAKIKLKSLFAAMKNLLTDKNFWYVLDF